MAQDSKSGFRKINQDVELQNTRDLIVGGDVTANAFIGDGSQLTGISTAAANDALITLTAGSGLTGGGGFTVDQSADATITISHSDTSSQASVNNDGLTVIQDITLDTYGHITAIGSTDISTAGIYVKTTSEVGTGIKIGLGGTTYQTLQFFANNGISVVRNDNEIVISSTDTLATVTGRGSTTSSTLNLDGRVNIGNGLSRPDTLNSDAVSHARIGGADVHLYVASLGAAGGYKVAVQAARTSDFLSFDLDLQSNGGVLRYGGNEVATKTWTSSQNYLTSYTETDPTVPSHVKSITTTNVSNWNTAFGWGNHAGLYLPLVGKAADSELLDGYNLDGNVSVATRIFNNKGQVHGTYTDFNTAMTPGPNYLQAGTNGPTGTASQWYGFMLGLGGQYNTETGDAGSYASQLYWNRYSQGGFPYLYARDMEGGTWGSWRKMSAGYADTAGSANSVAWGNISSIPSLWYQSGSWYADFASYSFVRENGVTMSGGSEFVLMSRSGQGHVLIDGSYWAGEGNGFYSLNTSNQYTSQVGFSRDSNAFAAFNTTVSAANDMRAPIFYDSDDTGYYVNPNGNSKLYSVDSPQGYVSNGNPWGTNNSAYFPNGITTAGGTNWIYGNTYLGNAPSNGSGAEVASNGRIYVRSSNTSGGHGYAGLFIDRNNAANNYAPFSFENEYGNHSWGLVSRFHITNSVGDRPSIQFSHSANNTRWSIGYVYPDDDFRITQNHGYRPDGTGNSDGWGTERFRIDTSGNTFSNVSSRAPIFYDSDNTGYYVDPASTSVLNIVQPYYLRRSSHETGHLEGGYNNIGGSGNYSNPIFTIGYNYNPGATSLANMYGIGYTNHSASFISFTGGNDWGMYVASAGTARIWLGGNDGNIANVGATYTPIVYDYNNTGYYVDPSSTSNFAGLTVAAQISGSVSGGANYLPSTGYGNGTFTWRQDSGNFGPYSGWHNYLISNHGDGSSYYNTIIAMPFWGPPKYSRLEGGSQTAVYSFWTSEGSINSSYDISAPRFYDSNNTGYYLDPSSQSNVDDFRAAAYRGNANVGGTGTATWHPDGIYVGSTQWLYGTQYRNGSTTSGQGWLYIDTNYGQSVVGLYTSTRYQGVWAMGDAYKLPADGTSIGNLYGMAWSHPNAGGVAGNLNTHGLLVTENGSFLAAVSGSIRSRDDMRAPIFYDSNNTGYYVDAASTCSLNSINYAGQVRNSGSGYKSYNLHGMVGDYDQNSTSEKIIWTIGDSWNSIGNMYGLGYTYGAGYGHHLSIKNNGATYHRISFASEGAYFTGTITASGDVVAYSDERTKENIKTIDNALEKVKNLRGVEFNKIGEERKQIGVIAQEIEKVLPEVVKEHDMDGMKTVAYGNIVGVLIEAIKEQQKQIEELKAIVNGITK